MSSPPMAATILTGFDDPAAGPEEWDRLLASGPTDTVFLTRDYQRAWWDTFGRGELLLITAVRGGRTVALAPLFADGGMIFFVGSGGSDYLDFVGDCGDPGVLAALLGAARRRVSDFVGFRFYHVPDESPTGERLRAVADRLQLACYDEGDLPAPALDLDTPPGAGLAAAEKKSLVRDERSIRRDGRLDVTHLRDGEAIAPHLDAFFEQHVARWAVTPYPSLFLDPSQRAYYRRLAEVGGRAGWLRFTRVDWDGRPVAFHFGFSYRGTYVYYKPSYCLEHARRSPGAVLLRHLLLAALGEGSRTFDFGLGDEGYKQRFANRVARVRTWGLYPPGVAGGPAT